MTRYVSATNFGKGFITHADQLEDGLKFNIVATKNGASYVKVDGDDDKVNKWIARVSGIETNATAVDAVVKNLPLSFEKQLRADIDELKGSVSALVKIVSGLSKI